MVPRTTTKKCEICTKYTQEELEDIFGFHDFQQNMCAISGQDPSMYDVCAGDSGGEIVKVFWIIHFLFFL